MIDITFTSEELNTVLQALYLLEDQEWYQGSDVIEPLIAKLNDLIPESKDESSIN